MKLTCVTAVFNAIKSGNRENLIRCVKSVAALKTEHEHLIYDGASTDGTVELLRELERTTPGLKVVSEPDTGIYNALNKGVRNAEGEWFYVLGCDDYITHPSILDAILASLPVQCGACISTVRKRRRNDEYDWFTSLDQLNDIFNSPCVCHQGELIRTHIARRLGGFDERYRIAADSDMFFKAHLAGVAFEYRFVSFAYFSYGGVAISNIAAALREHRESVANVLKLAEGDWDRMVATGVLPWRHTLRLISHSDLAIRQSAGAMLRRKIKLFLRVVLFPAVILTRGIRSRNK